MKVAPNKITGPNAAGRVSVQFGRHWPPASVSSGVRRRYISPMNMRCSEPVLGVAVAIVASRGPGR